MDVQTRWNSILELLERAYPFREFTRVCLNNPKCSDYRPLITTQDEWTIVKYVMEVLRLFWYWILWMLKRHTVTLHHVMTVYYLMFDHTDGVMRALAKKKTQWKEDLFFAVKCTQQKLSKYYTEGTPTTGMLLITAHIRDPFWKLLSFRKWDKGMDINPEDETSYTTQCQEAFLKYVENEYYAKHRRLTVIKSDNPLNNNLSSFEMSLRSGQYSYDRYDFSSDDDEYLMPTNVVEPTPGRSDRAPRLLTAARLYLNSPSELPQNWGQINPNLNDYHSDPMEISSTFWLPDITDWWRQQDKTHPKYADLSNVARNIFSIIPHGVGVEARFSLGRDVIGWRQSKTTGKTLPEKVVVRRFARANSGLLAGDNPVLDPVSTDNDMEMKREAEEKKLHRMAKVHDFSGMWQGSLTLRATQNESRAQNKQMTAVGYISDTKEIVKASWSNFDHDGAAAFKLSEKSPVPPGSSAKDLPGGRTEVLNVRRIKRIDRHPSESDDDRSPENISDPENWLTWNGDLDNPNDSEDDWEADNESDTELDNGSEVLQTMEMRNVSAAQNVPGLIRPIRQSKKKVEKALLTVNIMETRRNKGTK